MDLPYLTTSFPGIGGTIKQRPEDFFVQEIPLYEPSGEGEHVYCEIQKVGIPTFEAIERIARALRISSRDIGYAGLKDAQAVTRQVFSIWGTGEEAVMNLRLPDMQVLWARRHGNKLRLGHLAGNRFAIKIREVNPTDVVKLPPVIKMLETRGMPNYFGEQRFGRRENNHLLGAAMIRGDDEGALKLLLGDPHPGDDDPQTHAARAAFDEGELKKSMKLWPRRCGMERRLLARFNKTQKASAAIRSIDQKLRRLFVSALQSAMFNQVVAERINSIDKLVDGEVAWKHDSGACFTVPVASVEQPRCDAFEISPSGPLIGYRMTLPQGEAMQIEQKAFDHFSLKPADFRRAGQFKINGARRPLRVQPRDVELAAGVDEHGGHITVAFTLPTGSYATMLLRELMKTDQQSDQQSSIMADSEDMDLNSQESTDDHRD